MEIFCKAIFEKSSIVDIRLGSKYASGGYHAQKPVQRYDKKNLKSMFTT